MTVLGKRVASIDIFRGLTMLVMIFVNDLAGVRKLPWWTYHMPGNVSGMTYVDVVFPAFLFIVGLSIPLAIATRLRKFPSTPRLWTHVLARSAGLIIIGVALANADKGNASRMGITPNTWSFLVLLSAILFWAVYPTGRVRLLRYVGLAGLIVLFAIFRRTTTSGHTAWLDISYWEILGLIGWTYLAVCILYIPTRRWKWAPLVWLIVLIVLNTLASANRIPGVDSLPFYLWPFNNGAFCLMAMAGIVTTQIAGDGRWKLPCFGIALLLAGWLVSPLGISKINATPSWALYSAGISVLIFGALHWICDVRGRTAWAAFSRAAGENTLLTYLLPDLFYFAVGTRWLPPVLQSGWPGVLRCAVFTACILALSTALTRMHVRLHL